jgi:hypothetical protein
LAAPVETHRASGFGASFLGGERARGRSSTLMGSRVCLVCFLFSEMLQLLLLPVLFLFSVLFYI